MLKYRLATILLIILCGTIAPRLQPSARANDADDAGSANTKKKPNIIILFADDISARELPVYGSSSWTDPLRKNSSDPKYRAQTPVLDRMAKEGCWIQTAWAATVCRPSRAMLMTGRYAHLQKWWNNGDLGVNYDKRGKLTVWPVYESSPITLGHVAANAGYGTYWAGKYHFLGHYDKFGFDEACFTPGSYRMEKNPYTDFEVEPIKGAKKRQSINMDTGKPAKTYAQSSWYFNPHVQLMNHPSAPGAQVWWPNTPESKKRFGLNTYGPDVELEFTFDYMERMQKKDKPFFIYHASHLGHDAFNWFNPDSKSLWPETPIVSWNGSGYDRVDPNITGDNGVYDDHGTLSPEGIHSHINYLDYQVWLYQKKLKQLGIADNTVFIFTADNGTSGFGKNMSDQQRGCHVPMIIHAPGMSKQGRQDVLVSIADLFPTVAELAGFEIPSDYEINGESMVPFLFTDKPDHRKYVYSYRGPEQIVRQGGLLRDGKHKWWDVRQSPEDLTSFKQVKNWDKASQTQRDTMKEMEAVLPQFDLWDDQHDAPGVPKQPPVKAKGRKYFRG